MLNLEVGASVLTFEYAPVERRIDRGVLVFLASGFGHEKPVMSKSDKKATFSRIHSVPEGSGQGNSHLLW